MVQKKGVCLDWIFSPFLNLIEFLETAASPAEAYVVKKTSYYSNQYVNSYGKKGAGVTGLTIHLEMTLPGMIKPANGL